jgi:hypothetical protein
MLFCNDDFGRSTGPGAFPAGRQKQSPPQFTKRTKKSPYVYRKPHPATSSVLDGSNRCLTTLGLKKPGQVKPHRRPEVQEPAVAGKRTLAICPTAYSKFHVGRAARPRDRLLFVHLIPIRPRVGT